MGRGGKKRFCLVLVKPSHYDDDGYVIQWLRSPIPSNSLASLYGLAKDCAERRVLGDDVEIDIHAFDETNTRIRPRRIAAMIERRRRRHGDAGRRAVEPVPARARYRRSRCASAASRSAVGGFHVSGTLTMLDGVDADLRPRQGDGRLAVRRRGRRPARRGAARCRTPGALKPLYNFMNDLPDIEGTPIPLLAAEARADARPAARPVSTPAAAARTNARSARSSTCRGASRAAARPTTSSRSCASITPQGLRSFFITDDNFARNKDWEPILDRLIHLREVEKLNIGFIIQVDTLCHKLPNFIEKCARAGVRRVFIGLENINPDNLLGAKKRQNKITEYRKMLLAWKAARVITYAGYILGFPNDTVESILHDIEVIKRELPVDLLEFFYLTPLPGSEDHQKLHAPALRSTPT